MGSSKDYCIGSCSATIFLSGQDIMSQPPQLFNNRIGEIFVGIEEHGSSLLNLFVFFVLSNVMFDFFTMRGIVFPRCGKIGRC